MKGCKCSQREAGTWFLEKDILSSGFRAKPIASSLEISVHYGIF